MSRIGSAASPDGPSIAHGARPPAPRPLHQLDQQDLRHAARQGAEHQDGLAQPEAVGGVVESGGTPGGARRRGLATASRARATGRGLVSASGRAGRRAERRRWRPRRPRRATYPQPRTTPTRSRTCRHRPISGGGSGKPGAVLARRCPPSLLGTGSLPPSGPAASGPIGSAGRTRGMREGWRFTPPGTYSPHPRPSGR